MDFFNKLSKKASETYQFTKDKTTKLSGELKLRSKISDTKDKIEDTYKEIGEIVYSQIKSGAEVAKDEVVAKCEYITWLLEEIEKAEIEILSLKNIKKCEKCDDEIEFKAEFCPKCGEKQSKEEKVEIKELEPAEVQEAEVVEVSDVETEEEPIDDENKED